MDVDKPTELEQLAVEKRLESLNDAENKLVAFLDGYANLLDTLHSRHKNIQPVDGDDDYEANDEDEEDDEDDDNEKHDIEDVKKIIDQCYEDLSYASIHLRRELKFLQLQLPIPANLSKKATDVNNEKLKKLL